MIALYSYIAKAMLATYAPDSQDERIFEEVGSIVKTSSLRKDPLITLSMLVRTTAIGCAYYDETHGTIFIFRDEWIALEHTPNPSWMRIAVSMINQIRPSKILLPVSAYPSIQSAIQSYVQAEIPSCTVELRPSLEYSNVVKRVPPLSHLSILEETRQILADPSCATSIQAAGPLLSALPQHQSLRLSRTSLSEHLAIDTTTLHYLGVFSTSVHPNPHLTSSPDHSSLFGLISSYIRTSSGRSTLKDWFHRPLATISPILHRQAVIQNLKSCLLSQDLSPILSQIHNSLSSISSLPRTLRNLLYSPSLLALSQLYTLTCQILSIFKQLLLLPELDLDLPISTFSPIFSTLQHQLQDHLDLTDLSSPKILPNVIPALDQLTATFNDLPDILSNTGQEISKVMPPQITNILHVVYFPQLGYLVTIPNSNTDADTFSGCDGSLFEFIFSTDHNRFYKHDIVRALDQSLGDIHAEITDYEIEHAHWMRDALFLSCVDHFYSVIYHFSQLDCYLSLAIVAHRYNWICPTISDSLDIIQGRHPLYEDGGLFISNDIIFKHRCMAITGPNGSGKSVLMKQTGMLVYLAHIGSWIPAASGTKIPLISSIIACPCTSSEDSNVIDSGEYGGSFFKDLKRMKWIIDTTLASSLVLIDEFGKGTDSRDGVSLCCSVLLHMLELERHWVMLTTHFHEIYEEHLLEEYEDKVQWGRMEVSEPSGKGENAIFLYRFGDGKAGTSWGLECARSAGIPEEILDRAVALGEYEGNLGGWGKWVRERRMGEDGGEGIYREILEALFKGEGVVDMIREKFGQANRLAV